MKFSVLTFLLVLAAFSCSMARPVSRPLAQRVAIHAYQQLDPQAWPGKVYRTSSYSGYPSDEDVRIHLIGINGEGFVAVAASDRVRPLLGLTYQGEFEQDLLPPGLENTLDEYARIIRHCLQNQIPATREIELAWEAALQPPGRDGLSASAYFLPPPPSVSPLLSTTWNQGCNYNADCPPDAGGSCGRVWTGCGATALAQVLKYNAHPVNGFGSHSYTPSGYATQSANFGATTYNWAAMPNSLGGANAEVARLMHHCGVAADMQYGASVSNSYFSDVSAALTRYFRYSLRATGYAKFAYSDPAWDLLLRNELDLGRAMLYSGGSHFWVCDGYQTGPDLYHMNWGWGGTYDGWYALSNLNPGSLTFTSVYMIGGIEPADPFEVEPGLLSHATGGVSDQVKLSSDSAWTVVSSVGWLTASMSGGADGYYEVNATSAANPTYSARSGYLAFARGNLKDTVFVDQGGIIPSLNLSPATVNEGSGGGLHSLTVSSDSSWIVLFADAWLGYSPGSGVGPGSISLTVSANGMPGPRSGMLVVERGGLRDTVWVNQGGTAGFWCVPNVPSPTAVGATRVILHSLDRTSTASEGYVFASDSTLLGLDSTYLLQVTFSGAVAPAVWIDWNRDGDFFDAGEAIVAPSGSWYPTFSATKSINVTVPSSAATGQTRMRVYVKTFPGPTSSPCDSLNVGDIEDFDVYIYNGSGPMPVSPLQLRVEGMDGRSTFAWGWNWAADPQIFLLEHLDEGGNWQEMAALHGSKRAFSMDFAPRGQYRTQAALTSGESVFSNTVELRGDLEAALQVYPNPVALGNPVRIRLPDGTGDSRLELLDAQGKLILARELEAAESVFFPTSNLKAGLYWLRVRRDGVAVTGKIVLQ